MSEALQGNSEAGMTAPQPSRRLVVDANVDSPVKHHACSPGSDAPLIPLQGSNFPSANQQRIVSLGSLDLSTSIIESVIDPCVPASHLWPSTKSAVAVVRSRATCARWVYADEGRLILMTRVFSFTYSFVCWRSGWVYISSRSRAPVRQDVRQRRVQERELAIDHEGRMCRAAIPTSQTFCRV